MKQRLYIISLDAFGAKDLEYAKNLPNFKLLLERSAVVEKVKTIYPSLTYIAHTSIVTGVFPNRHGILNNTLLQPSRLSPDWHWYAKDIQVPTLFDIAHQAGYEIASFLWPVTGRSKSIRYNLTEIFPNRLWQNQIMVSLYSSSPKFAFDLNRKFGHLRKGIQQPELDEFLTAAVLDTIEQKNPDLMAIHLVDLDSTRHKYGVNSKEAGEAIHRMDDHLGQIIHTMKKKGIFEETVIAVLGDHYQIDTHSVVRFNTLLEEKGWLKTDSKGKVTEWEAIAHGAEGSCYIYTRPGANQAKLRSLLESYPEVIEAIYTGEEAAHLGADKNCTFLLEAQRGYYFAGNGNRGPFVEEVGTPVKPRLHKATHGFSPKKEGYETMLFLTGPGIQAGVRVPLAHLVDEAPTFLHAIGLKFPHAVDGKVLDSLFVKK